MNSEKMKVTVVSDSLQVKTWNSQARILSGYPIPTPGDLPQQESELRSPALQANFLPAELSGSP